MSKEKPKIFLSYAREDMGMAKQLYNDLKRYGLDVWLDTESLLPGDKWKEKIKDAIENSNYFIALLSTKSVNKKGFVQKELKTALEVLDFFPSSERFILPIRLDDCEVGERKLREHQWVDLFPEREYQNGLKKILRVVCKEALFLRNKPKKISEGDATEMIRRFGFYDKNKNPEGKGLVHKYKLQKIKGDKIVYDEATGLMWQQSGSDSTMLDFEDAKRWIKKLRRNKFAGYDDWRLPTLEEAMSLIEPKIYINSIFNSQQKWIWTADQVKDEQIMFWVVDIDPGGCYEDFYYSTDYYVRAVRSGQSSR